MSNDSFLETPIVQSGLDPLIASHPVKHYLLQFLLVFALYVAALIGLVGLWFFLSMVTPGSFTHSVPLVLSIAEAALLAGSYIAILTLGLKRIKIRRYKAVMLLHVVVTLVCLYVALSYIGVHFFPLVALLVIIDALIFVPLNIPSNTTAISRAWLIVSLLVAIGGSVSLLAYGRSAHSLYTAQQAAANAQVLKNIQKENQQLNQ